MVVSAVNIHGFWTFVLIGLGAVISIIALVVLLSVF
jgi:hypothetical protein